MPDLMTPQPNDDVALPTEAYRLRSYFMTGAIAVAVVAVGATVIQRFDNSVGEDIGMNAPQRVSSFSPELPKPTPVVQAPPAQTESLRASAAPAPVDRDGRDFSAVVESDDVAFFMDQDADQNSDQMLDFDELPPSLRKQLPSLKLTGHLYSLAHPKARKVILNGIALKEKQYLDDEMMVNEITPDGVILDFQGRLFRMGADQMFR